MITNLILRIEETDFHGFTSFGVLVATESEGTRHVLHRTVNHRTRAEAEAASVGAVAAIFGFEGAITLYADPRSADLSTLTTRVRIVKKESSE